MGYSKKTGTIILFVEFQKKGGGLSGLNGATLSWSSLVPLVFVQNLDVFHRFGVEFRSDA